MKSKQGSSLESTGKVLPTVICVLLLVVLPLVIDNRLSARDRYYTELLRTHECINEQVCEGDLDGNGTLEQIFIDRGSSARPQEYWLVAKENGKELLRLRYWELDNTTRSHAALDQTSGKTHLLVYEQKGREAPTVNVVYAWNGNQMSQIPPSEGEKELFKAMAARDDNGTFVYWVFYRVARIPVLVGYYLLLVLLAGALRRKAYRTGGPATGQP